MKFAKNGENYAEFLGIDPFLAEIIKQIPLAADPEENGAARARLFCAPSAEDEELIKDWQDFVVPDLETQFYTATQQVREDLVHFLTESDKESDFPFRLRIPLDHGDAWLSALNQARLVLAARFAFTEEELSGDFKRQLTSLRDLALYQIAIYGWMQELLITAL